jgi:hypothetical protein
MSIDLPSENLIPLRKAAEHRLLRAKTRGGRALNFSTIWRWAMHGVRGVKLETVRVGSTLCTSEQAIIRFIERLTAGPALAREAPLPSQIREQHAAAERALTEAGV